ncbi:hypothetical protein VAB18032_28671 [Micromonospora maris AB-18-032]|nr:hypothetical protein VAB18032_28671 [Micromonospora maris AB-18-032]
MWRVEHVPYPTRGMNRLRPGMQRPSWWSDDLPVAMPATGSVGRVGKTRRPARRRDLR